MPAALIHLEAHRAYIDVLLRLLEGANTSLLRIESIGGNAIGKNEFQESKQESGAGSEPQFMQASHAIFQALSSNAGGVKPTTSGYDQDIFSRISFSFVPKSGLGPTMVTGGECRAETLIFESKPGKLHS